MFHPTNYKCMYYDFHLKEIIADYFGCLAKRSMQYFRILLIMKLTVLLIGLFSLQVSATALAQGVTLAVKNAKLKSVITEVNRQTGYDFVYYEQSIDKAHPITISVNNAPIEKVLNLVFSNQPFSYEIFDRTIIIKPKAEQSKSGNMDSPSQQQIIRGRVTDGATGTGLPDVIVQVKGGIGRTVTDQDGNYELANVPQGATLQFRLLGYEMREAIADRPEINVGLRVAISEISEVQYSVNTGYQSIPKERATGSFVQIDNELFNRRVSTNVLDRLEGVASGIRFNPQLGSNTNESPISIRGRSTIMSNTEPLVILDNFPYEGDINNLNPNSIESITVLRDAAAASIWGARSGNGVIVITTKKGRYNQPFRVELNSNVTVGGRPDLYYSPSYINTEDFIEVETFLFDRGAYDAKLNNTTTRPVLSPLVEMLALRRAGTISESDLSAYIASLQGLDVRDDFSKYFYQNSVFQQYALNISGGSDKASYIFSAGYDDNQSNQVRNGYDRLTLTSNANYTPVKNLELNAGITYTQSNRANNNSGFSPTMGLGGIAMYPYAQLADASGNALVIPRDHRQPFKETTGIGYLLDWNYRPLDELNLSDNTNSLTHVRINTALKYTFIPGLSAEVRYQQERQNGLSRDLQGQDTYFTRNLINRYSSLSGTTLTQNIPLGDILDQTVTAMRGTRMRGQINFDRTFSEVHNVTAIAGIETGQTFTTLNTSRLYGYNDDNATHNSALDYRTRYTLWQSVGSAAVIPYVGALSELRDVNVSYYTNAAYTFRDKYIVSASARIDQSNLFGVDFNQKGVPLWSVGGAWKASDEAFYNVGWLPSLKLRTSYGYSGNVNKSIAALLTATYSATANQFGLFTATVNNPPNPDLQWEKIGILNVGMDFELVRKVLSGNFEYYLKRGEKLISIYPVAASTGILNFTANVADMKGSGFDLELSSRNIDRTIKWRSDFLLSYNTDRVTKYEAPISSSTILATGDGSNNNVSPFEGKPVYSVFSYKWAGLNPATGDPQGYLNGEVSTDWAALTSPDIAELVYHGPARPVVFGGLRNTIDYKDLSLSFNFTFKVGYWFRASSIHYANFYAQYSGRHSDLSKRWKQPGDELVTNVPSMVYPASSTRDQFFLNSEVNVHKGDHIRLQDVSLGYTFNKRTYQRLPLERLHLFLYLNNLGVVWKANDIGLDPDRLSGYLTPRTIAVGLRTNF